MMVTEARTAADLAAVRDLLWAFRDWLDERYADERELIEMCYARAAFAALLDDLPGLHARPTGMILLARGAAGTPAGCCMYAPLPDGTVELKRMYVGAEVRGEGVGRKLVDAAIAAARADGYRTIRLDTGYKHHEAQALYRRCGFRACGPYHQVDPAWDGKLLFFERAI